MKASSEPSLRQRMPEMTPGTSAGRGVSLRVAVSMRRSSWAPASLVTNASRRAGAETAMSSTSNFRFVASARSRPEAMSITATWRNSEPRSLMTKSDLPSGANCGLS